MTITWYNSTTVQCLPKVILDFLVAKIVTNRLLHLGEPKENFLVCPGKYVSVMSLQ